MSHFTGRVIARIAAGAVIAGVATWSAPGDARGRGGGHTFHSVRHGPPLHLFVYNSYPRIGYDHRPYVPYGSLCNVYGYYPCVPGFNYPLGQDLQLTIESRAEDDTLAAPPEQANDDKAAHDLNTIRDVFSALRACWNPPAEDVAQSGTQMTVRLSFNRYGGMISEPRVTYVTPDISSDVREVYWHAVTDALKRCTPMPFTDGLGGALAGRPFAIRFVDNRSF